MGASVTNSELESIDVVVVEAVAVEPEAVMGLGVAAAVPVSVTRAGGAITIYAL